MATAVDSAPVPAPAPSSNTDSKSYVPPFLRGVPRSLNGIAPVKAEYLLHAPPPPVRDDDAAESGTNPAQTDAVDSRDARDSRDRGAEDGAKRQRTDEAGGFKKLSKEEKKARKGSNKARRFKALHDEVQVCFQYANRNGCTFGDQCKMSHDLEEYLKSKDKDIHFATTSNSTLIGEPPYLTPANAQNPFVSSTSEETEDATDDQPRTVSSSFDVTTTCPVFEALGYCPQAWKCRFLGGHVERVEDTTSYPSVRVHREGDREGETRWVPPETVCGWRLKVDEEKRERVKREGKQGELNACKTSELRELAKKTFNFPVSEAYLKVVDPDSVRYLYPKNANKAKQAAPATVPAAEMDEEAMMNAMEGVVEEQPAPQPEATMTGAEVDKDDVPMRPAEKKRLEWRDKTYLAPLTTVGNLPFRRICVDYGADITCGEMALGASLVQGSKEEWALTKRHRSEKMFGVQVCGGKPAFMVPTAEAVARLVGRGENRGIDFVDLNLGCPIDLVFQKGAGSALLESAGKLGKILVGMNSALGDIPLTVKFRTGISANKSVAHKLVPRFANEWGISAMTLHGRSRQQRYSKLADWDYIKECANTLRAACADEGVPAPPIFGNGDCYSAQSYYEEKEASGVDGVMVARGALIKPWIFTEIQERREWDISAVERLEGYRKYAEFGLDHWGPDTKGVNTTRRFLCEAISFQHRYVPIGLLERMPPMMNERPPAYKGRSELETLLASPNSADWVKISEMFLGKCPDDFKFNPKHKSNAYGSEEGQG